jgi:hypothetical protein
MSVTVSGEGAGGGGTFFTPKHFNTPSRSCFTKICVKKKTVIEKD